MTRMNDENAKKTLLGRTQAGQNLRKFLLVKPHACLCVLRRLKSAQSMLQRQFGEGFVRLERGILTGAERFGNYSIVKPMPRMLGMQPKDFTLTLAETSVIYNVTFPGIMYASVIGMKTYFRARHTMKSNVTD